VSRWVDAALVLGLIGWTCGIEPRWVDVSHPVVEIAGLPPAADGLRVAVLTDIHHGPWLSRGRVRAIVARTNALQPDVTVILGDVVHRDRRYIGPVWEELSELRAPLGVYAVLGNHEHWEGAEASREAVARADIQNAEGRAIGLVGGTRSLYLVGLGELMETQPSLAEAMREVGLRDVALVITHNPDVFEQQHDPRAQLWLAGHTHGGQVYLPWLFRPWLPSLYGPKYRAGWVARDGCRIYVSRGLGCITPPVRLNCRPELPVIELRRAAAAPLSP
jgi:predicted MPP superfamily phosphohydrolase